MAASTRIEASKLPGGRGHGEPVRLFIDLERMPTWSLRSRIKAARKFLVASYAAAMVSSSRRTMCSATTRKGKQVLNLKAPDKAARHDHRRRRTGGRNRRKPQNGDLCARPGAGDGRAAAACGCSATRKKGFPTSRLSRRTSGLTWTDGAGRSFTLADERAQRLARQPRRRRPYRAKGFPEE